MSLRSFFRNQVWRGRTLFLIALGLQIVLAVHNQPLITGEAPHGGVSFEFVRTLAGAESILESWSKRSQLTAARTNIQLDFAFIVAYVSLLFYISRRLAHSATGRALVLARAAGTLAMLAGVFDVIENLFMLRLLAHHQTFARATFSDFDAWLVWANASMKFGLLGLCFALFLILDITRIARRVAHRKFALERGNPKVNSQVLR